MAERVVWQAATIAAAAQLTPRIKRFLLRPEMWRPFLPGQHLDIRLTAEDGYEAQRSYSVTSEPEMTEGYEVAVELIEDGEVSPYFHEVAQVGDIVDIRGPFGGHFVWTGAEGPAVMMGGGSGMAPIVSMLRHRAALGAGGPPVLAVCAARSWEDVIYRDELLELDGAGVDLRLALSRDAARREKDIGRRIDAELLASGIERLGAPAVAYVCGSNRFVDVAADLLIGLGMPAARVRTERYGGSEPTS